jgi:hypothetical protein
LFGPFECTICERFSASQAQEFPENPYFLFVPSLLGAKPTGSKFSGKKVLVFFGKIVRYSVKKYVEYSVKTNYSSDTEYSGSVKRQMFRYLVFRKDPLSVVSLMPMAP